tara:strand:- start:2707 stop:2886 length:180 start_codon:yes stop_codon:yes gene_type:complete
MINRLFKKKEDQNEKLIRKMNEYEEKKTKQQESKVLGQKPVKGKGNKEKGTSVYNSSRL